MFGLQLYSRRYSQPQNLRGNKLNISDLGRTQSLKFRKINEIRTSRTHLPDYDRPQTYRLVVAETESQTNSLFFSHSKILKGTPLKRARATNGFLVEAARPVRQEGGYEQALEKDKIYFYSANLDQNANLYMNRLLNQSELDRKEKIRQIQEDFTIKQLTNLNVSKTQNQFWRKMRKSIAKKQQNLHSNQKIKSKSKIKMH